MIIKPLPNDEHLFQVRSIIICKICGGDSLLIEQPRYDSTTEKYRNEKCLNDKCRYYKFDPGTLRTEEDITEEDITGEDFDEIPF